MDSIPADIQAADAAGQIPSGISLEYLAEAYDKQVIIGIIVLVVVSFVVLVLRCFARVVLLKRTGIDDLLMVLAMVCTLINLVSCLSHPFRIGYLYPHCCTVYCLDKHGQRPSFRVHPICPLQGDSAQDRSAGFRLSHSLHQRSSLCPVLRSRLLSSCGGPQ